MQNSLCTVTHNLFKSVIDSNHNNSSVLFILLVLVHYSYVEVVKIIKTVNHLSTFVYCRHIPYFSHKQNASQ